MKLIHLGDLHIGKRVNNFSMLEDQADILDKISAIIADEKPDAVLIAGDVYDRGVPSEEAVTLFDDFLFGLTELGTKVCLISGNHDSAERVAFGGRLMSKANVFVSPVFDGTLRTVKLRDEGGNVNIWLIPFLRPSDVRSVFPDEKIENYEDAMRVVLEHQQINLSERNIAVSHQFITGAQTCDSEEYSVGGVDQISYQVYDSFDYVALGHLHGPQRVGRDTMRYAGSPLKYSFSEVNQKKCVTVIETEKKGDMRSRQIPLTARREWISVPGKFDELILGDPVDAYAEVKLTDDRTIENAMNRLRGKYPNIMTLYYERGERTYDGETTRSCSKSREPIEFVAELFKAQMGSNMDAEQFEYMEALIRELKEAKT